MRVFNSSGRFLYRRQHFGDSRTTTLPLPPPIVLTLPGNTRCYPHCVIATISRHHVNISRQTIRNDQAEVLTSGSVLVTASNAHKEMLLDLLNEIEPRGSTNFEEVSNPATRAGGTGHT